MISTIIHGGTASDRSEYIRTQAPNPASLVHLTAETTSIGIKQIQALVLSLSLTSSIPRLVWIEEASTLTPQASNALLKILEEPPHNTTIYLTTDNALTLLSTIRSRCQIIALSPSLAPTPPTHLTTLKPLMSLPLGERLTHLSDFPSDKSELLELFSSLAQELSTTIRSNPNPRSYSLLSTLSANVLNTHSALNNNVNPTLALSHFLLHLPKSK